MLHYQDCCESVYIEDVCGDVEDLIGSVVLQADEVTNCEDKNPLNPWDEKAQAKVLLDDLDPHTNNAEVSNILDDSFTWTFYRLATAKGSVVLRWLGESNGYYSESVDFIKII